MSTTDQTAAVTPATAPYAGRRLIVFLCMHRTGSSLAADMLSRLGMALGPYELIGASESNKYGHFESVPFHSLNRELQQQAFGFADDLPDSPETLRQLVACAGRWPADMEVPASARTRARELIAGLVAAGPISGFKDPRTLLMWPFWRDVLAEFKGLEVVPLFLVRSPHEIAMSIFSRAKGALSYFDALDVTAVHFQRMIDVRAAVSGPCPVVCFEPQTFPADLARAAEICGLRWDAEQFARVYDTSCRHHEPAVISHPAQKLFLQLRPDARRPSPAENVRRIENDAVQREALIRTHIEHLRAQLDTCRAENAQYAQVLDQVGQELKNYRGENQQYAQALRQCGDNLHKSFDENQRLNQALAQCTRQFHSCQAERDRYAAALEQCGHQLQSSRDENARYAAALAQHGDQFRRYLQEVELYAEALTHSQRELRTAQDQAARAAQHYAAEVGRRDQTIRQLSALVEQRDAELTQYAGQVQQLHTVQAEAEQTLVARHTEIERLNQEVRQRVAEIAAARAETVAARDEIARAQQETAVARAETAAARDEIARAQQETVVAREEAAVVRAQAARLEAALTELRQRFGALEHELNLIKHSRTWRFREMVVTRLRAG
jgi:predicted  nucleic acid-binding Zn-ribbon protein